MEELTEQIRKEAILKGANCKLVTQWDNPDIDDLARRYIEGIDFCIKNDFPSVDFLKKNFGDRMHQYGIFADEKLEERNLRHVVVNGKCRGKLIYDGCSFGKIYVRHRSKLDIVINDDSIVNIEIYDDSKITLVNNSSKRIYVYKYGGRLKYKGDVMVKKRQ